MTELFKCLIPMNKDKSCVPEELHNLLRQYKTIQFVLPNNSFYENCNIEEVISKFFNKNPILVNLDYKFEVITANDILILKLIPDPKSA